MEDNSIRIKDLVNHSNDSLKEGNLSHVPFWICAAKIPETLTETNCCRNFVLDYVSAALFFACGLPSIATTVSAFMDDWHEGSALFLCLIAPSGMSKTNHIKFAVKPVKSSENGSYFDFNKELTGFNRLTAS